MSARIYLRHAPETPGQKFSRSLEVAKALSSGNIASIGGISERERTAVARDIEALNKHYAALRSRDISADQVQDDRFLTNLSVQYANDDYIGLLLMPPAPVKNLSGKYPTYDRDARLEGPDDEMEGRSTPNEIDDGERGEETYNCKGRSLKNTLDWVTMMNQVAPLDEMVDLTAALLDIVALKRERRIADIMTSASSYNTSNVITVGASDRWDASGGGDPIGVMQEANSRLWRGRGPARTYAWMSLEVWNIIARHAAILDLHKHTVKGLATPNSVAEYFGWDGILVSEARRRTSKKGQASTYGRMYGNNFGVCRVAVNPSPRNAVFGYTMSWMGQRVRVSFDPNLFTDGGYIAKCSHHEDYKVVAKDTGVLVQTPVTPFS